MSLPKGFVVGVATSAFQTEGSLQADGRGPSIWDHFTAGGETAVEHYRRWEEDLELLGWLGVDAYRFSLAWPRIFPRGQGRLNRAGLDFYARLVDRLLERDIMPFVTLYHWDLPAALPGGWKARDTALAFSDYALAVGQALGDRVRHWITLNEPWCSAHLGYGTGEHAPGESLPDILPIRENLAEAHRLGVQALHAAGAGECGPAMVVLAHRPASCDPADARAAVQAWEQDNGPWLEAFSEGDFLGLNVYYPSFIRAVPGGYEEVTDQLDLARNDLGWPLDASVVSQTVERVWSRVHPKALYITETGCASADDALQRQVLEDYLGAAAGCAHLRGTFLWTLTDNLEWQHGFGPHFGLFTRNRQPRASGRWLAGLLASRC